MMRSVTITYGFDELGIHYMATMISAFGIWGMLMAIIWYSVWSSLNENENDMKTYFTKTLSEF